MYTMKDLITLISQMIQFFTDLYAIEKEKLEAAQKRNLIDLEECMKKEQAALLRLRGLDKKREDIQKALSFENLSFREILQKVEGNEQKELKTLFDSLQNQYTLYNSISSSVKEIIENNLYKVDQILSHATTGASPKIGGIYSSDGNKKASDRPRFTSRKV